MPNLAGKALPYIRGMKNSLLGAGFLGMMGARNVAQAGGRFHQAFKEVGGYRSLFQNRTALGAMAGAAYGGMGENGSLSGAIMGAGVGAGAARYGGMFMKSGMTSGIGMRGAAMRMAAVGRSDGRRAGRFIASTAMSANRGYGKIRSNISKRFGR